MKLKRIVFLDGATTEGGLGIFTKKTVPKITKYLMILGTARRKRLDESKIALKSFLSLLVAARLLLQQPPPAQCATPPDEMLRPVIVALRADVAVLQRRVRVDLTAGAATRLGLLIPPFLTVRADVAMSGNGDTVTVGAAWLRFLDAVVLAVGAETFLAEELDLEPTSTVAAGLRIFVVASGAAGVATVVAVVPVVVLALTVVITAGTALGDVVTGEETAVLLVDCALVLSHGGDATTGVVDLLPGTVIGLPLEAVVVADQTVLDLRVSERVGTPDFAGRVLAVELVEVGARPLDGLVNLGRMSVVVGAEVVGQDCDDAVVAGLGHGHTYSLSRDLSIGVVCDWR